MDSPGIYVSALLSDHDCGMISGPCLEVEVCLHTHCPRAKIGAVCIIEIIVELTHAYAISVHKAQGSEFPAIVLPVTTSHYLMLQRNLLYTAITRARDLCVLTGSRKAISLAVRNNKVAQRFTALEWRLGK